MTHLNAFVYQGFQFGGMFWILHQDAPANDEACAAHPIFLNRAGDPRLCRGGSNSLTFPEVHRDHRFCEPPSTRKVKSRWTSLKV